MEKGGFAERLKAARAAPATDAPPAEATAAPAEATAAPAEAAAAPAPDSTAPVTCAANEAPPAQAPTAAPSAPAAEPAASPTVASTTPAASAGDASGELEVWFWDEMRLGLHGQVRRVWAPVGEKVEQLLQIQYKWSHLVLAVCPTRGEVRWRWVPNLKGPTLAPVAVEWFGSNASTVLVWDGAPGHRNHAVAATGVRRVLLPPYSPELDPAERVFRAIRPEVEGQVYATLEEKQAIVEAWLRDFGANPARVRSLTAWSWLLEQIKQAAGVPA